MQAARLLASRDPFLSVVAALAPRAACNLAHYPSATGFVGHGLMLTSLAGTSVIPGLDAYLYDDSSESDKAHGAQDGQSQAHAVLNAWRAVAAARPQAFDVPCDPVEQAFEAIPVGQTLDLFATLH